jgi:hypothetical protein
MNMRFDSTNAKHKLFIAGLLLTLFAVPFTLEWSSVTAMNGQALLAGGAAIAGSSPDNASPAPVSNNAAQASEVTGHAFVGGMAR